MNKTTIKISVLAFLGFMTYGYAQQQDHEGKVGINTTEPIATMDIRPNDENARAEAKTNEGIIAPKLSKTRIANIETPVEGTLVYATDNVYTGTNDKVAKITEKGYYFYNGTEWVKAGSDVNSGEWVYDAATKRINLKRSGQGVFKNKVFYNRRGGLVSGNLQSYDYYNNGVTSLVAGAPISTQQLANEVLDLDNIFYNANYFKITADTEIPTILGSKRGGLSRNILYTEDISANNPQLIGNETLSIVAPSNTKNIAFHAGSLSGAKHDGTGDAAYMTGIYADSRLTNGTSSGYSSGGVFTSSYSSSQSANLLEGVKSIVSFPKLASGTIKNVIINNAESFFNNQQELTIQNLSGMKISHRYYDKKGTVNIDRAVGYHYSGLNPGNTLKIKNNYGILIENIGGATDINRAIHTEAGNIRFGDLQHSVSTNVASTGDRPVFVTADGVLKIGNASTALSRAIWETNGSHVKLAVKADGTDRTDNIITINDAGQIFASSFKGTNGATIFPDYVFQKYYTGTSSIKADYNFKSLSQVEDFVKVNGHLPGYKSAATIKAQGYVDLMETQLTNVEKIEELYLHSIEQDKALKAKDAEIADLKQRLERLENLIK